MELVVRKNDLLKELSLLQGIVERKNTIPILANVLIEASRTSDLSLLATDLDVGLAQPMRSDGDQSRDADAAGEEAFRDRERAARHGYPDRRREERQERHGCRRSL